MKSMKDMKKAVAEFRTSYIALLDEVTVLPLVSLTSPFGRRPNLFILQSFISLFFVHVFHAAILVSPFISTAEAFINATANFWPFAVRV